MDEPPCVPKPPGRPNLRLRLAQPDLGGPSRHLKDQDVRLADADAESLPIKVVTVTNTPRAIAVLLHPERPAALRAATQFVPSLAQRGIRCLTFGGDLDRIRPLVPEADLCAVEAAEEAEVAVVFGGDGTILRAAEWAYPRGVPLLGVNLGHVGFLAELEPSDVHQVTEQVLDRDYQVEERFTVKVVATDPDDQVIWQSFAVNELSVERPSRERMLRILVSIDERPLSLWSCDGLLVSTPTGSTAYAFSAGGPVIWPDVQAFLVTPLNAHALFSRPLVLGPDSIVDLDLMEAGGPGGILCCDGRRTCDIPEGSRIRVVRGGQPLRIARLSEQPFTSRLVRKFALPVTGWRSNPGGS